MNVHTLRVVDGEWVREGWATVGGREETLGVGEERGKWSDRAGLWS